MKRAIMATTTGLALALAACSILVSPDDYVGDRPDAADGAALDTSTVDAPITGDSGPIDAGGDAALPDSLWVYYRFDGDVHDFSGNGRDGTLGGATATLDAGGKIGTALSCASPGDKVKIGDDFHPGSSSFTVALFYRLALKADGGAVNVFNSMLVKGSAWEDSTNDTPGFGIGYNDGAQQLSGFIRDDVSTHTWVAVHAKASSSLTIRDATFHHAALVVDRDSSSPRVSFYVDGKITDFVAVPAGYGPIDSPEIAQLGSEGTVNNPAIQLHGALDEVMIFTRALGAAEIADLAARTHD